MYNYIRRELFVGSQILPGFTKRKEKISNLAFSGLYPNFYLIHLHLMHLIFRVYCYLYSQYIRLVASLSYEI